MPHISLKMIAGRDEKAKESLAQKISQLVQDELGCKEGAISIEIQDFPVDQWKPVYDEEILGRMDKLIKKPAYHYEGDKLIKA